MKTDIQQWADECTAFQQWFSALGGNIASDEQMSEAFKRIEAKNVSDNRLYKILEEEEKALVTNEFKKWRETYENLCTATAPNSSVKYINDSDND